MLEFFYQQILLRWSSLSNH